MFPGSLLITCPIHLHHLLHYDGAHAVSVAAGEMLVGDGLGPGYSQDSSTVLGVEGGQFVEVALSYPPAF